MKQLIKWKGNSNHKPLILMGVRQAGKTYLLEQFGRENFSNYHIINFEKQIKAHSLFESDLDPKVILNELQFFLEKPIDIKKDMLIFDEIQACPRALTSLKYFCEELPELALCSAGSLLGLHLNEGSYPVGKVDMMYLHPMTFSEFLAGTNDQHAADYLSQIDLNSKISETAHQHLWQRLKHYFITGGLPEVISVFADQQDNLYNASYEVRNKQEQLIKAYYTDIAKHSGKINAMHIDRTWRAVPAQLSKTQDIGTNRFKFKGVIPNANRYAQLANVIDWLSAAELVIKIPLVNIAQEPLSAFTKENFFKLLMFDVGILGAMSGLSPKTILEYDYGTYKGYFAENFVAQQLQASGNQTIFSWQEGRSEIEFLLQHEGNIIPIEVKSGKVTRAKSMRKFIEKHHPEKSFILSANNINVNTPHKIFYLPMYLAERLLTPCTEDRV